MNLGVEEYFMHSTLHDKINKSLSIQFSVKIKENNFNFEIILKNDTITHLLCTYVS